MRLGRVLLGLDHDPARISGKRAEQRRIIDATVARHGEHASEHGIEAWELGKVVEDERKRVWLRPVGLVGEGEDFSAAA